MKHIDLGSLDFHDAVAIVKQKIYDLARYIATKNTKEKESKNDICFNYIINILTAHDHMVMTETEDGEDCL